MGPQPAEQHAYRQRAAPRQCMLQDSPAAAAALSDCFRLAIVVGDSIGCAICKLWGTQLGAGTVLLLLGSCSCLAVAVGDAVGCAVGSSSHLQALGHTDWLVVKELLVQGLDCPLCMLALNDEGNVDLQHSGTTA